MRSRRVQDVAGVFPEHAGALGRDKVLNHKVSRGDGVRRMRKTALGSGIGGPGRLFSVLCLVALVLDSASASVSPVHDGGQMRGRDSELTHRMLDRK